MEKESKNKKKIVKRVLSVCLVLAGVLVIAYPIVTSLYSKYMQKELKKEFYRIVEANANKKTKQEEKVELKNELDLKDDSTLNEGIDVDEILEEQGAATSDEKNPKANKDEESISDAQVVEEQIGSQNIIGLITIDSLGIEYVIVEGANPANINAAVGHVEGTKGIGQKGNCAIAGHRGGRYGEFFMNLNLLKEGAKVEVKDLNGTVYEYSVYEIEKVKPNETKVIKDIKDETTLTLITCEDEATKRIIVHARLVNQRSE